MKLTIHRGSHEIGGTCIQIESGSRSILLDAGSPLGESRSDIDLARLDFNDIFISHPHQDHFGLIENLPPDKPVHIGETACQLIAATRVFLGKPPLANTFSQLRNREWVELGPNLRVMPYLMDHSCVDAFGLLVEADGKRVYYSGDFRAHGRRKKTFDWFLADPPRGIDLLLMEGTMIERENDAFPDEDAVEKGMLKVLRQLDDRACFLICSGQHIDRLCAAFSACIQAGRIFVTDIYTAYILRTVFDRFPSIPDINTAKNIRVLTKGITAKAHYQKVSANRGYFGAFARDIFRPETMIDIAEIVAEPYRYFLKISYFSDLLERLEQCGVIYSMWSGYLKEPKHQGIKQHPKVDFREIHTSGHAVREDLQRMAVALQPKRLVPVHTENGEAYRNLFGNSVVFLRDGETLEI
ncbi:MBL fold metallo-hydrolase [Citrifermentans bremense]|uniref:MBL fold metallo-hydrolase n=1 Tax=Citrifermentans bremense TaxID=60035 RepID=UPI00040116A2|nr:MBL fold metallo-hydrolase [Citrifermentans bremense]